MTWHQLKKLAALLALPLLMPLCIVAIVAHVILMLLVELKLRNLRAELSAEERERFDEERWLVDRSC